MKMKILGSGCKKCNDLESNARDALEELKLDMEVVHITDFLEIASYGVMSTPALVIEDKVISSGKVLKKKEIIEKLKGVI